MIIDMFAAAASAPPPSGGISLEAWLTIAAIILGPVVALWIQRGLDRHREQRARRLWIFRELMVTRGARVSQRHVDALNSISLEFNQRPVLEAWDKYFDLFVTANPNPTSDAEMKAWRDKGDDLLAALLYQMGKVLKYKFSETDVKRKFYVPRAHDQLETEETTIRKGFFDIFGGTKKFPIDLYIPDEVLDTLRTAAEQRPAPQAMQTNTEALEVVQTREKREVHTGDAGPHV